jgi:hypothetical protein
LKAWDRAREYFEQGGFTLAESIVHLHGKSGFTEIRLSGGRLVGNSEYDSRVMLDGLVKHVGERYGFKPSTFSLHFHTSLGHVDVHVSNETPAEVVLESLEHDHQVREFANKLPKP